MISICLASSFILSYMPYIGFYASFAFLCWIDAYYCFEFVWIAKGMSLEKRTTHLEERWAYYFAFGLPVTALCSWGTSLANAASFALVFPAYIILAMYASPVPLDPYKPTLSYYDDPQSPLQTSFLPSRLPIFSPVLWLNNKITQTFTENMRAGGHSSTSRVDLYLADDAQFVEEGIHTNTYSPVTALTTPTRRHKNSESN